MAELYFKRVTTVVGVDPGVAGAIVVLNERRIKTYPMPIETGGKVKLVSYSDLSALFRRIKDEWGKPHVFLERAVPMAMGSAGAFTYGRGFEAILIALSYHGFPVTQVEPAKWAKEMHEGISADLKPKVRSFIAVKRLYPHLVASLPKKPKGGLYDGPIDALLIAGYGLRKLGGQPPGPDEVPDFF